MSLSHQISNLVSRKKARWLTLAAVVLVLSIAAGCDQTGQMRSQPKYNPLSPSTQFSDGRSARVPVAGSVAYSPDGNPDAPALTGKDESGNAIKGFPVKVDQALVQLGQERYDIYCIPCHGPQGKGDGKVIGFGFPKPADLTGEQVKALANGDIFDVITNGKGKMFPYGYRVKPPERWAVIAYIRALEVVNGPVDPAKLTPDQLNQIGGQP